MRYLYVFIDESGNYDFSSKGTKWWVLTSLITTDLNQGLVELFELKHRIIDLGTDIEKFHASEDRQSVRDMVFPILARFQNVRIDSVIVEKRKAAPSIRSLNRFYPMMVENLLKYPFDPRGLDVSRFSKVFIFADRASARKTEREALIKALKVYLAGHLQGVPYVICMHDSASHHYLQAVDYFCWAIYVRWEKGEQRPYRQVQHLIRSEFPIFQHGYVDWY
ncbi:MAG: DUF3800 domain-containing protein [Dehalococcoidia bacterium]